MKNGYAFVEFDDHRDADDACYELNGKDLMGERITVERARGTPRGSDQWRGRDGGGGGGGGGRGYGGPPRSRNSDNPRSREKYGPPTRTQYRVIVENLSSRCSWQDLKDYMRKAGEVTFADAHKLAPNEGVVEFISYSDMKNAIDKLHDTEINGRRIKVFEDRRGGGGGGRRNNRSMISIRSSHYPHMVKNIRFHWLTAGFLEPVFSEGVPFHFPVRVPVKPVRAIPYLYRSRLWWNFPFF
ncbi:hypothetical protein JTB14_003764 [Gonioctena quinquepunctata]|nr:hypothetical protein JTB14_003764 [Gonioctena quinquepunctata]